MNRDNFCLLKNYFYLYILVFLFWFILLWGLKGYTQLSAWGSLPTVLRGPCCGKYWTWGLHKQSLHSLQPFESWSSPIHCIFKQSLLPQHFVNLNSSTKMYKTEKWPKREHSGGRQRRTDLCLQVSEKNWPEQVTLPLWAAIPSSLFMAMQV